MSMSKLIAQCQQETKETYGYRRVKLWLLQKHGLVINHKAVLRLMRKYGLLSVIRRPRPLYQRQQRMNIYENSLLDALGDDKFFFILFKQGFECFDGHVVSCPPFYGFQ